MERRAGAALDPLAVPAAGRQSVLETPVDESDDVDAQPDTVGEGPGVDAAVDFAAPIGQVLVFPPAVISEQVGDAALA